MTASAPMRYLLIEIMLVGRSQSQKTNLRLVIAKLCVTRAEYVSDADLRHAWRAERARLV